MHDRPEKNRATYMCVPHTPPSSPCRPCIIWSTLVAYGFDTQPHQMIIRGSPYGVDPRSAVEMELTVLDVSDQARQILRTSRLLGGEHTSGVNICNMLIMKDKALSLDRNWHDGRDPCEMDRAVLTSNRRSTLHAHDRLLIWCACCCSTKAVLLHHEMQGLQRSST